jgi:hypothetical protein
VAIMAGFLGNSTFLFYPRCDSVQNYRRFWRKLSNQLYMVLAYEWVTTGARSPQNDLRLHVSQRLVKVNPRLDVAEYLNL